MKSFTTVLVAGFAALAQAVELTNTEFDVEAGKPFQITWADAQGPVTLTLKNGASSNLQTVQTITSGATGTSFTWTPPSSLPSDNYAIEITDSTGEPNYSVQFPFVGSAAVSASPSASAAATSAASISASVSTTMMTSMTAVSSTASSETASFSAANATMTAATSASASATRTSVVTGATTAPTTVPNGNAGRIGSPIALIGLTIAAMLYFQ